MKMLHDDDHRPARFRPAQKGPPNPRFSIESHGGLGKFGKFLAHETERSEHRRAAAVLRNIDGRLDAPIYWSST